MPPGTGIRAAFDQACAAAGIRPAITLEASAAAIIADLAARGMGVAILSESMTGAFAGRLRSVLIEDARTPALLTLAWRAPGAPAVAELVRHCQAAFAVP
jgi:DNA-binding transcriptional LysR family regulator